MMIFRPRAGFVFAHPAHFLAFGFGVGLARVAPGTFGTLLAFPLWWLIGNGYPPLAFWIMVASFFACYTMAFHQMFSDNMIIENDINRMMI